MKAEVLQIQWHRSEPVNSVDFSPRIPGRLVTSGGDNFVRIWETRFPNFSDKEINNDESNNIKEEVVEFRSTLAAHNSGVNVVRWSPKQSLEEYIASGDNSGSIIIWKQVPFSAEMLRNTITDEDTEIYKEAWRPFKILTGHKDEVSDLAWAPCGKYLASVGTDQRLRVWDVRRGEVIGTAHNHTEVVQGVCWDPSGIYIATQSFDRYVNIYSVILARIAANRIAAILTVIQRSSKIECPPIIEVGGGLKLTTTDVKETSNTCRIYNDPSNSGMSFFRRPSFSPDGKLLACPAAIIEGKNAVMIYNRNLLGNGPVCALPGLRKPAWVVKYSPIIYSQKKMISGEPLFDLNGYRVILAVGTEDGLFIYDSQNVYPLVSITNMHLFRYQDVTWSSDGLQLVAASLDGYCTLVTFLESDLGEPLVISPPIIVMTNSVTTDNKGYYYNSDQKEETEKKVSPKKIITSITVRKKIAPTPVIIPQNQL